jgi:hypothetical protein
VIAVIAVTTPLNTAACRSVIFCPAGETTVPQTGSLR